MKISYFPVIGKVAILYLASLSHLLRARNLEIGMADPLALGEKPHELGHVPPRGYPYPVSASLTVVNHFYTSFRPSLVCMKIPPPML